MRFLLPLISNVHEAYHLLSTLMYAHHHSPHMQVQCS